MFWIMTATLAFGSWNFPHGKVLFTVCTYSGLQRHCSLCPGAVTFQHAILGMDQKETAFVTLVGWWAGGLVGCWYVAGAEETTGKKWTRLPECFLFRRLADIFR
jgi:hypothetical protein